MAMQPGMSDRDALMEQMMQPGALPMEQEQDQADPAVLLDGAIQQLQSYIENPAEVTPETVQQLMDTLIQAREALGGGDAASESALPIGPSAE